MVERDNVKTGTPVNAVVTEDSYKILGDVNVNVDPIIKERLKGMVTVLNSLEVDPEMWNDKNPIWQNTNNHVMYMLRKYYHDHETDDEIHEILGSLIDHFVWLYVSAPELRARVGWMTWFLIVYVTDNQFRQETGTGLVPEPWNDPRSWAMAAEASMKNPIVTKLEQIVTVPPTKQGPV